MKCKVCDQREADFLDGMCVRCRVEHAAERARITPTRLTIDGETGPHIAATVQQPAPVHNEQHSAHDLVIADMRARKAFGFWKYKTILQARNGRDPLVDAYQEQLDLVAYMRLEIEERGLWMYQLADEALSQGRRFEEAARLATTAPAEVHGAYRAGVDDAVGWILRRAGELVRSALPGCTRKPDCPMCTATCCDHCGFGCWDRDRVSCSHDIFDRHSPKPIEARTEEPMRVWLIHDTEKHWIAAPDAGVATSVYLRTYDFGPDDFESFTIERVDDDARLDREMDDGEGGKGSLRQFLAAAKHPELLASSVV